MVVNCIVNLSGLRDAPIADQTFFPSVSVRVSLISPSRLGEEVLPSPLWVGILEATEEPKRGIGGCFLLQLKHLPLLLPETSVPQALLPSGRGQDLYHCLPWF